VILTGNEIWRQAELGNIKIDPIDPKRITTNSYDVALGPKYLRYLCEVLDPKTPAAYELRDIPPEGLFLPRGDFVLGATREKIGSDHFVPIIHARSGTARAGLFIHVTADLIDIGSFGNLTLQLFATVPIRVYAEMLIAQVTFWVPRGTISLYKGKYQNSDGPQPSKTYLDFQE
jgi:dCTP deaminase